MDRRQPPPNKTAELDPVLHSIGFQIEEVSPSQVTGRLPVTPKCCQVRTSIDRSIECVRSSFDRF
jgi:acyl-coenzyme A thioesterase PaaI-like protein